jgi:hypothetical protein
MMLWKVLRPRWWLLRRQITRGGRRGQLITLGFLILVLGGAAWLFEKLRAGLAGPDGAAFFAALFPGALTALLFFALIQLADTLYQLFLAPDTALVLTAPVPVRALFLARLLGCTQALWLPAAALGLVFVALGAAQGSPPPYYPLALTLVLALTFLATATGMLVVLALTRLVPPRRLRELLPAAFGVAAIAGMVGQQALLRELSAAEGMTQLLLAAPAAPDRLALLTLGVAGAALGVTAAAGWAFGRVFFGAWGELRVSPAPDRAGKTGLARLVDALTAVFPREQGLLIGKDWRLLARDPQRLTNLLLTPVMMIALMIPILADPEARDSLSVLGFWFLWLYASLFGLNTAQGVALPAFLLEGRRLMLLRQTPVSMPAALWAKLWATTLPAALVWTIALAVYGLFLSLPPWQIAALALTVGAGLLGACAVLVAIGALAADFNVAEPRPKLSGAASLWSWAGLALGALAQVTALAVSFYLILALAPGEPTVAAVRGALGVVPPLAWATGERGWLLLAGGMVGQAVLWAAVAGLWRAARRRLETWEPA